MSSTTAIASKPTSPYTKENAAFAVGALTFITFVVMNVLGINGVIGDPLIISAANISLFGLTFVLLSTNLSQKESKCKQIAKIICVLAPLVIINALSIGGVHPFSSPYVLGLSSFGAAIVMVVIGACIAPARELTAKEAEELDKIKPLRNEYQSWDVLLKSKIEVFADRIEAHRGKLGQLGLNIPAQELWVFKSAVRLVKTGDYYLDAVNNRVAFDAGKEKLDPSSKQTAIEYINSFKLKYPMLFQ